MGDDPEQSRRQRLEAEATRRVGGLLDEARSRLVVDVDGGGSEGIVSVNYTTVDAYAGDTVATVAIAGMVLGGLGNVWGAVVGGLIVALLQIYATHFCGADVVKIPVWGLLLLVLIFKPTGLFGHTAVGKGKF